jgi:hypothetical protein
MYKSIEFFYDGFRKYMSLLFETFTFRTKPQYQPCNGDDLQDGYVMEI